ncbi:GNAT family N-acetyltransferase [Ensifer adhaerens]|uniref:GNAT family N-acetyltransferase n=1 Tax=Ensifer adhaerens TaxID=106592 RepID=UPI001C4E1A4C|nr:GNAT family N-acetyltransferase [Ensifer adhaerens]MBW0366119.1 GNAT family N-acetyltransferase [Ensifer adhaerens]UCM19986.1 GNAT family N-acetyltransferase [Ensifer adhaerens]
MDLEVKPADQNHLQFAWQLYSNFVQTNLFSGGASLRRPEEWNEKAEFDKFQAYWNGEDRYVILVDNSPIGWVAIDKTDKKITIENWHLVPEWRGKDVTKIILSDLVPKWKSQGLEIEAAILQNATMTSIAEAALTHVGFSMDRIEQHSKIMRVR